MPPRPFHFVNNSTVVVFFSGDLQARWYELGVQKGGGGGVISAGLAVGAPAVTFLHIRSRSLDLSPP